MGAPRPSTATALARSSGVKAARFAMHSPSRWLRTKYLADFMMAFLRQRQYWAVSKSAWRRQRGTGDSDEAGARATSGAQPSSWTSYSSSSRDMRHRHHSSYVNFASLSSPNTPSPYGNATGSKALQKPGENMLTGSVPVGTTTRTMRLASPPSAPPASTPPAGAPPPPPPLPPAARDAATPGGGRVS